MVAEPYNGSEVRGRHLAYCQDRSYGGPLFLSLNSILCTVKYLISVLIQITLYITAVSFTVLIGYGPRLRTLIYIVSIVLIYYLFVFRIWKTIQQTMDHLLPRFRFLRFNALGEAQGPPPAQAPLGLNLIPPPATVTAPMNSMKDVNHVTKFNGENFSDYRYEFLIIMEQFGLASLIDATGGQVEVLPAEVKILFNYTCVSIIHE